MELGHAGRTTIVQLQPRRKEAEAQRMKTLRWLVTALALAACTSAATAQAGTTGADLQISGSASTGSPDPGGRLSYTFQIRNSGSDSAAGVVFTDAIPAGTTYLGAGVSGLPSGCSFGAGVVSCDLQTVPKGSQLTVILTVTAPTAAGTFSDTGTVSSTTADAQPSNNSTTITAQVKAAVCPIPAGQSTLTGVVMAKYTDALGLFENFELQVSGVNYLVRTNFYDGSAPLTTVINLNCAQSPVQFVQVGNIVNVSGVVADGTPVLDASVVQVLTFKDKA
jgi:uncharacterized repeat protein (TIGR01451 family)